MKRRVIKSTMEARLLQEIEEKSRLMGCFYPDGYDIVVRPWTEKERIVVEKRRGRDGFSFGKGVCILPSAKFYSRGRPHRECDENEWSIQTEREEED